MGDGKVTRVGTDASEETFISSGLTTTCENASTGVPVGVPNSMGLTSTVNFSIGSFVPKNKSTEVRFIPVPSTVNDCANGSLPPLLPPRPPRPLFPLAPEPLLLVPLPPWPPPNPPLPPIPPRLCPPLFPAAAPAVDLPALLLGLRFLPPPPPLRTGLGGGGGTVSTIVLIVTDWTCPPSVS